jgi:hypothetical protein
MNGFEGRIDMKDRGKEGNFMPFPRSLFKHDGFKEMSASSRLVFVYLLEMEHRYTGKGAKYFFRSNKELADEIGVSEKTVQNSKNDFKAHIPDLIKLGYVHWWLDQAQTRKSSRKVTTFTVLI